MSENAVRIGDQGTHGGVVTAGAATVLIEGRPAARQGDPVLEPLPWAGHGPQVIVTGSRSVRIEGRPAAREVDRLGCGAGLVASQGKVRIG